MGRTLRGAGLIAVALLGLDALLDSAVEACNGNCGPNSRRYSVVVKCDDAAVEDAETRDTLTLTAWDGDEFMGLAPHLGVICSLWYDPGKENAGFVLGEFDKAPTHFILETSGGDAFFADWITVTETKVDQYGGPKESTLIAQYGAPGDRGFCLSRDPNDHSGTWAAASDACDPAIKLGLKPKAVYAARPTDLAQWKVELDCHHSGLTRTLPWATISIAVYDAAGKLVAQHSQPHRNDYRYNTPDNPAGIRLDCGIDPGNFSFQVHGLDTFVARSVSAIEISVGPLDDDYPGPYEGSNRAARLYIDRLTLVKDWVSVMHWGIDEGSGWCLSRYPDNWEGVWQIFSDTGCFPGVRFEVENERWTPLP